MQEIECHRVRWETLRSMAEVYREMYSNEEDEPANMTGYVFGKVEIVVPKVPIK